MAVLTLSAVLLSTVAIPACAQTPAPASPAVPVEVQTVTTAPVIDSLRAVGSLRADQSIIVRPEVAGVVVKIGFSESMPVTRGQLLFKLDDSIARAEVQ